MKLYKSIDKRLKKISKKIKRRYLQGLRSGKGESYYYNIRFYHLYLKRFLWLILNLLLFRKSAYKSISRYIKTQYYPHLTHREKSINPRFKTLIRSLFGYSFLCSKNLYPVLPADVIFKTGSFHFSVPPSPLASVIIYASNRLSYTYNCLIALREHTPEIKKLEIIVINDYNDDSTSNFFTNRTEGIKYIHNRERLGYSISINNAVSDAKSEFICLLNCDVEVQENWLRPLLMLLSQDNSVACAGSKLLLPNNTIAEAGGALNYTGHILQASGRRDDPAKPQYNFIREVDYCSAGSLLIRKSDFEKAGNLDERYSYPEFALPDLCISFREFLSKKVIYQPLSSAYQFESRSGNEHQIIHADHSLFCQKWEMTPGKADSKTIPPYRRLLAESTLIIIAESLPEYDKSIKALKQLKILEAFRNLNYHVILIPEDGRRKEPYYSTLIEKGIETRTDLTSECSINEFARETSFLNVKLIWTCGASIYNIYQDKIKLFGSARIVSDIDDLRTPPLNFDTSGKRFFKYREQVINIKSDGFIAWSPEQRKALDKCTVKQVYSISDIPIFRKRTNISGFANRSGIIFSGDFRQVANIDAATWLVLEIMPCIWSCVPDIPLYLAGSNPPSELTQLAGKNILFSKHIHEFPSLFDKARVAVSPLRYSADPSYAVGQSLQHGLPLISTSIGTYGFHLENGKNVLIADNSDKFKSEILRCYTEQVLWEELSSNASDALISHFPQTIEEHLKTMLCDLKLLK